MATKREEQAILTVNGRDYRDWESVTVKHELGARPPFTVRFTCSEGLPIANNFAKMQIKPGDTCSVTLAGYPAFTGKVMTRQVYYDANRHHIEIQAGTFTDVMTSSVIKDNMEYKDQTFDQIAKDQLKRVGVNLKYEEGTTPPSTKFPRVSAMHGETIIDFLETIARPLGLVFTSNPQGDFVVAKGPNSDTDSVMEGRDILIGREIIYNESMANSAPSVGQGTGNDKKWGAKVAHVPFATVSSINSLFGGQAPGVIPFEMPTSDNEMLKGRSTSETQWLDDDKITVIVTVYGWQRPSGGLWRVNMLVSVYSEMLMMRGNQLKAKSVTFTQDNRTGTRTTLDLRSANNMGNGGPSVPGGG